jgi:Bacterial Ig-like domain (group 3)
LWQFVPQSAVYPVTLTSSTGTSGATAGTPFTLSWTVNQGLSKTANNCYAFSDKSTQWTGQKTGSGQQQITEGTAGNYYYGLTCSGDKTANVSVVVNGSTLPDSSTALSASPTTASVGQSVTLTATVTSANGQPTGSVSFSADGVNLGSAPLNGGVASITASSNGIPPGTYPIFATYSGSASYKESSSSPQTVTLSKAATSTTLIVSPNPITAPASATLTATVSRSASGSKGIPSGTITFTVNGLSLGNAKLNASGVASLTASSAGIAPGSYPVTATYGGDSSDTPSSSSAVTVTVK